MRSSARETINRHETIVIESRTAVPAVPGQAANTHRFEVIRACLDSNRGTLPLRITWSYQEEIDGNPMVKKPVGANPWKVLETTEIIEFKGAGFYPSKGSLKVYGPNFRVTAPTIAPPSSPFVIVQTPQLPVPSFVSPLATSPFAVVEEITTWVVAKIEANKPSSELYTVPIPKDTYYYDETQSYTVRSGHDNDNATKLPWSLSGILVAGWVIYAIVALMKVRMRKSL